MRALAHRTPTSYVDGPIGLSTYEPPRAFGTSDVGVAARPGAQRRGRLAFELRKRGGALKSECERRLRDLLLGRPGSTGTSTFREDLARRYISGDGIEIGALHRPLRVPRGARVRYVDIAGREALIETYTSRTYGDPDWVVETDIVDDGERLAKFADASVDFVIANHLLEHIEDPIAALENFVRVTRPRGILFLTLPDARTSFDQLRSRTTIDHLLRDHREGPEGSRVAHYREWAMVECLEADDIDERVAEFARDGTRHHFHVWELEGFLELLGAIDLPVVLAAAQTQVDEFAVILRRVGQF